MLKYLCKVGVIFFLSQAIVVSAQTIAAVSQVQPKIPIQTRITQPVAQQLSGPQSATFQAVSLTLSPFAVTGLLLRYGDLILPPFTVTGLGFQPVDLKLAAFVVTGSGFQAYNLNLQPFNVTGLLFKPVDIALSPFVVTGLGH